ncbi:MAG: NUDIX domain-containing protein [Actinomycetota bacterium]
MQFHAWPPDADRLTPANDLLDEAVRQIEAAELDGDEQHRIREELLDFLAAHPDALHRSCLDGHLTGSGIVVDPRSGRSLLIHHAKLGRWLQPGGHADGDGNLAAVAWKEATEETGLDGLSVVTPAIDIDIHHIPSRPGEPEHLHLDLRHLVLVGADVEAAPNEETLGARWMLPDDPEIVGSDELHRAVSRACRLAVEHFGPGRR